MYISYSLRSAVFVLLVQFCASRVDCEVVKKNCTTYQQVFKENLRNCVVGSGAIGGYGNDGSYSVGNNSKSETNENIKPTDDNQNLWEIELTNKTGLTIQKNQDDITLKLTKLSTSVESRKKKIQAMDIIPYLIIPGFISAGVLPWLIPGMKLAVMGVAMINQMAFTSSLFTLIRGYIFDTSQEDHVVYINHGYEKYKHKNHLHR